MKEKYGENWWDKSKGGNQKNVDQNIKREEDSGFTIRSEEKIDYTTFGELSQIVTSNWEAFEELFKRGQKSISENNNKLKPIKRPNCSLLSTSGRRNSSIRINR